MSDKKETKVRTSITIDPDVLEEIRKLAEDRGVSVSKLLEDAARALLAGLAFAANTQTSLQKLLESRS